MLDDQGGRGPSWYDVQRQMEWLEREYLVTATFFMHPNFTKGVGYRGMMLILRADYRTEQTGRQKFVQVWAEWPKAGHKTMPAAIMYLTHNLSEKLIAIAQDMDFAQQPMTT